MAVKISTKMTTWDEIGGTLREPNSFLWNYLLSLWAFVHPTTFQTAAGDEV
jgi:hypothetical protein